MNEWRNLLTAADVVAALRGGEIVEVTDDEAEGWVSTILDAQDTEECVEVCISDGSRYRARITGPQS
jgi:hypothetical protein